MQRDSAALGRPTVLFAPDKFRGTATAAEAAATMAQVAVGRGWDSRVLPLSDGGEGLLEAFGGANMSTDVTGPLGQRVSAPWRLDDGVAIIESAAASGLLVAGGAEGNDPIAATSAGTGELISAALAAGASRIVVGLGGSACTDGGRGALEALSSANLAAVTVCCDVETRFLDAAVVFGPQKGATPEQVERLTARLVEFRGELVDRFGRDPQEFPGSGAAGGLGGALAAAGARMVGGLTHIAGQICLEDRIAEADLVVTGEGRLDASSVRGKVVGGVVARADALGVPVVAVVGDRARDFSPAFPVRVLSEEHGLGAALADIHACLRLTVDEVLTAYGPNIS